MHSSIFKWFQLALLLLVQATYSRPAPAPERLSAEIFERTRPAVIKLSTVVTGADKVGGYGSGFLVSDQGVALTNYHVVADHLRDPPGFALEYASEAGRGGPRKGRATVLAFDVVHDLAVVQTGLRGMPYLRFDTSDSKMRNGEALYSMGNPRDLGLTITSGSYSGLVGAPGPELMHYTGVLNAGMSGGPALNARGQVVGVNVAKRIDGEQLSFLVPGGAARALLERAINTPPLRPADIGLELTRQLEAYQASLRNAAMSQPWSQVRYGPYLAPEFLPDVLPCSAGSNHVANLQPTTEIRATFCTIRHSIQVSDDLRTGYVGYSHRWLKANRLNDLKFAALVDDKVRKSVSQPQSADMAPQQCRDADVQIGRTHSLRARVLWCAQPYRDLAHLYDVTLVVATRDKPLEALVSQLKLEGVTWDTALQFTQRFLDTYQ